MTKYELAEFKEWLAEKPERKEGLPWDFLLSHDFANLIEWSLARKNNSQNMYQRQYQILGRWMNEVDQQEREREREREREQNEEGRKNMPNNPINFRYCDNCQKPKYDV